MLDWAKTSFKNVLKRDGTYKSYNHRRLLQSCVKNKDSDGSRVLDEEIYKIAEEDNNIPKEDIIQDNLW